MRLARIVRQLKKGLAAALLPVLVLSGCGSAAAADQPAQTQTDTGTAADAAETAEEEVSTYDLNYVENKWNFVEESLPDISGGIPEDAVGRLRRIRETGILTVATGADYPPQEFIDPSKEGQDSFVGADMELARYIADKMGVELEIVPLGFHDVLTSISAGSYDLAIAGLSYTPARASSMTLSKGYYFQEESTETGILIREEDRETLPDPDALKERVIAAQSGSLQEAALAEEVKEYGEFQRMVSVKDLYEALADGTVDAAAVDYEAGSKYLAAHPEAGFVFMEDVRFSADPVFQGNRVAAPPDELMLMYFVNAVLDEVTESGRYDQWIAEAEAKAAELGL